MGKHAKLSASGAKKWLNCSASINLESNFADKTSQYAEEGTRAHDLCELKLKLDLKLINKREFNKSLKKLEYDVEMEEHSDTYVNYIKSQINRLKSSTSWLETYIEKKLDYSNWVKGGFGTVDFLIISDDTVVIIDFKYGQGVRVSAENNEQLKIYALGAIQEYGWLADFKYVELHIVQPRIDNIDSFKMSAVELLEFGEFAKERALLTEDINALCSVGTWCDSGFCKARPQCKKYNEHKTELLNYEYKNPNLLTDDEIEDIVNVGEKLSNWAKMVKEFALDKALSGTNFSSLKVVEGKSNRRYISSDEDIVTAVMTALYRKGQKSLTTEEVESLVFDKKMKSVASLEKLVGKNVMSGELSSFWEKPVGSPTLVSMTDKRPALNSIESEIENFTHIMNSMEI